MTQKEWSNLFAARVRSRLEYIGMTRKELCEKIKVEHKTYDRWMNGERIPKATDIVNIAKALGCSVGYLIYYGDKVEKE